MSNDAANLKESSKPNKNFGHSSLSGSKIASDNNTSNSESLIYAMTEVCLLSGKNVLSWICRPDVEKAEWLNRILQKLWPYVGDSVEQLLKEKVQKSIQKSSALLSGFAFKKVDLGKVAPRIAGIKVHDGQAAGKDEITIDMQIVYEGDCNIVVGIDLLSAGIRDIKLTGLVRIELKPLLSTLPLVGAVSISFVGDPDFDFDLTNLANILDLPIISGALRCAISDSIGEVLVLPERYIIKVKRDLDVSYLRFPLPKGMIRVHVIEAKDLAAKDKKFLGIGGKSDPYVVVKVGHQGKFKTKTIDHTINPKWNEVFDSFVRDVQYGDVQFNVFDDDGSLNKADFLGKLKFSIKTVYHRGIIDKEFRLLDTTTGKLHVRMEWFDLSSKPSDYSEALKQAGENQNCALLNIFVDGASNLPANQEESYKPSPFLKITVPGNEPMTTQVVKDTNNPTWEENFRLLLAKPESKEIVFEVMDSTKTGSLGVLRFKLEELMATPDMTLQKPFELIESGPKAVLNMRISLRFLILKTSDTSPDDDKQ